MKASKYSLGQKFSLNGKLAIFFFFALSSAQGGAGGGPLLFMNVVKLSQMGGKKAKGYVGIYIPHEGYRIETNNFLHRPKTRCLLLFVSPHFSQGKSFLYISYFFKSHLSDECNRFIMVLIKV